jgi:hypothetical protein
VGRAGLVEVRILYRLVVLLSTRPSRRCGQRLDVPAGSLQRTLRGLARDKVHLEVVAAGRRECKIRGYEEYARCG